jgi:hypothetical protein
MQRVELLSHLEEQLGGDLEESQLSGIYTVRDLVDAVLQSAASGAGAPGTRHAFAGWKAILAEQPDPSDVIQLARPQPISAYILVLVFAADTGDRARPVSFASARNRKTPEEWSIHYLFQSPELSRSSDPGGRSSAARL